MKKNMLTEINNIRKIMGLRLLMEDTKTEIYTLLKKLSSESTSETEKNEIKTLLKRANVTDEEIQRLLRGGEQTLTQLARKIEGNLTVELSTDLEKILVKSGVASEAFRELGDGLGARLIDSVESLYTAMKNGQITMEDYLARKDAILDRFDETFNRQEMERALKSMENDVETKIENARRAGDAGTSERVIDSERVQPENVDFENLSNLNIPEGPIANPDNILENMFAPDTITKVRKKFSYLTDPEIAKQYDLYRNNKALANEAQKRWDEFFAELNESQKGTWEKLSKRTKLFIIFGVGYGINALYAALRSGKDLSWLEYVLYAVPVVGAPLADLFGTEKLEDWEEYVLDLNNYFAEDENEQFIGPLGEVLKSQSRLYSPIYDKIKEKMGTWWKENKNSYSNVTMMTAMDAVINYVANDIDTAFESKIFYGPMEETDPRRNEFKNKAAELKQKIEDTLKNIKLNK